MALRDNDSLRAELEELRNQQSQSFGDSTSFGERLALSFSGGLGNAITQHKNQQAQLKLAKQNRIKGVRDQLFQAVTQNYRESTGSQQDKDAYSGAVQKLYGQDSMQFQTLFSEKQIPGNVPPSELEELGGGPSPEQFATTFEPTIQPAKPKGGLINLVNRRDSNDIIAVRKDDPELNNLIKKGYIVRDKPSTSARGAYTTLQDIVVDGKTVRAPWNHRLSAGENMVNIREYLKTPDQLLSKETPAQKARVKGAEEAAKAQAKRLHNMEGFTQLADQAQDILTGKKGELPTASGVGAAVDWVSRIVGKSPSGANSAAALKAIGGALTSKVPRFEGPQSDRDIQSYREMAAQIGDATIPIEQRLTALAAVRDIWSQFERGGSKPQPTISEGATATNPSTGEKIIFKDGKWQKAQ